ncbi:MAG: DUF1801 domain-containing protein [Acidimicrobiia bacterium]|nr:DUF1801 domain-containing protein [Acidimicrobiia bacterium]
MADNKTQPTSISPATFVAGVEHDTRRADAEALLEIMGRLTGNQPKMWGPSIIGFGRYHYVYESGREGDFMIVGFSPRKANLVVYLMPGYEDLTDQLARLGKHKIGKSCLYINKLADVDQGVLEEMITISINKMRENYETFDD